LSQTATRTQLLTSIILRSKSTGTKTGPVQYEFYAHRRWLC